MQFRLELAPLEEHVAKVSHPLRVILLVEGGSLTFLIDDSLMAWMRASLT